MKNTIIILCAGQSKRFNSSQSKVLHNLAGKPIYKHLIEVAQKLNPEQIILVTSPDMEKLRNIVSNEYSFIEHQIQKQQLGTGDAVKATLPLIKKTNDNVMILYGDHPLFTLNTLRKMLTKLQNNNDVIVAGFESSYQNQYARLITNKENLLKIIEFKNANKQEKEISLCNSGIMSIKRDKIDFLIKNLTKNNLTHEYYLTEIIEIANSNNLNCSYVYSSEEEVIGINTRYELSIAEKIIQKRIIRDLMEQGVTIIDPENVTLSCNLKIGKDSIIHPYVIINGKVEIGENVEIKSFSHIEGATIDDNTIIGPFARIRPGTKIKSSVKIGNFVEIKNSIINKNSKINHLTYIGDSEIGCNTNIGAGVITCNYDGIALKHKTYIGNNVSVGSNSTLIAPITINDGVIVGAGSVINKDIEKNSLAISRINQVNIKDKAIKIRNKKLEIKNEQ